MSVIYQEKSLKEKQVDRINHLLNHLLEDIKKIKNTAELSDEIKRLMIRDREELIGKLRQKFDEL